MRTLRQVIIKNRQNYFFNSMTNIKNFDPSLLSIDQVLFKKKYFKNLDSLNSLYLVFNNVDTYIEENNKVKYLIFTSTYKNKKALENYTKLSDEIKDQIELLSNNKPIEYKKNFMKIKSGSDDELSLGKILNIPVCVIIVRSVFHKSDNYYLQVFLHECFYEYEYELENGSYAIA